MIGNKELRQLCKDLLTADSESEVVEVLQKAGIEVMTVGDAKDPKGIAEATRSGFIAGISI